MDIIDLGLISYPEALEIQEKVHVERVADKRGDALLFCEHPPVYTIGVRNCDGDFLLPAEQIKRLGVDVVKTNRGGRVTYHGPGQLVCYPIIKFGSLGVRKFVYTIEEIIIQTLREFEIEAVRDKSYPGVWTSDGPNKIAAIGLHVSHGVSMHGFALNVTTNLDYFKHIVPCGIRERGVTSMEKLLGHEVSMSQVRGKLERQFGYFFSSFTSISLNARSLSEKVNRSAFTDSSFRDFRKSS